MFTVQCLGEPVGTPWSKADGRSGTITTQEMRTVHPTIDAYSFGFRRVINRLDAACKVGGFYRIGSERLEYPRGRLRVDLRGTLEEGKHSGPLMFQLVAVQPAVVRAGRYGQEAHQEMAVIREAGGLPMVVNVRLSDPSAGVPLETLVRWPYGGFLADDNHNLLLSTSPHLIREDAAQPAPPAPQNPEAVKAKG